METLEIKKKLVNFFIFITFFTFYSCTEEQTLYEKKILKEASSFNQELSMLEIKKRATKLKEWSSVDYFKKDIQKFIDEDKTKPPPKNAVLFLGSSSIVLWKSLEKDMHPFQVINRGFGGAHIAHVNNYLEEIVFSYKPRGIVFFCGSNDIFALKTPEEVFEDFLYFYIGVKNRLPTTKVLVIGIKPSLTRDYLKEKQLEWNNYVSSLADEENNLFLIDVRPAMLLENGEPDPGLFIEDGLHMNEKGYKIWTEKVKPYLEYHFKPDKG